MKCRSLFFVVAFFAGALSVVCGQKPLPLPQDLKAVKDVDYVGQRNPRQQLDLYVPKEKPDKPRPLVVFIHGGGWSSGNKSDGLGPLSLVLTDNKYAGASIGYRLTDEAIWPAQIHDCKAALRWLKKHAEEYGYDADRIALFGISAGGHLVSLLGTSGGVKELEGTLGETSVETPRLRCVINFCGPANFLTFPGKGSIINENDVNGPIAKLFGGPMKDHLDLAKAASPISYVTADDPPFLHIHGTKDELVPYAQAQEFDAALEQAGVSSTLLTGTNGGHVFYSEELVARLRAFLAKHLLDQPAEVAEGPVAIQ